MATSARPGSIESALAGAEQLVGGGDHRAHVLGDASAGGGRACRPRRGRRRGRRRGSRRAWRAPRPPAATARGRRAGTRCACAGRAGPPRARCVSRSIARGACARREAELRARVAGEDRGVRVGDDARRDADHHLGGLRRARRACRCRRSCRRRSARRPRPRRAARCADFALPWRTIRSPLKPGASAPARARRRTRRRRSGPPRSNTRSTAVHGNALEAKTTSPSPIAARELARAAAQVVLGDGVQRRAELARELGARRSRRCAGGRHRRSRPRGYRWLAVAGTAREVRRRAARARPRGRAARASSAPGEPSIADRHPLRLRQPEGDGVVAAHELDQEALEARADQVDRRSACPAASGRASATAAARTRPSTSVS